MARDHGEGEVVLDDHGRPLIRWSLSDEVDRRLVVRGFVELTKLQRAATEGGNVFAALMDAVRVCSLGQISDAFFEVGGQYRRNV